MNALIKTLGLFIVATAMISISVFAFDGGDGGGERADGNLNTDNGTTCGYPGTGNRMDYGSWGGVRG